MTGGAPLAECQHKTCSLLLTDAGEVLVRSQRDVASWLGAFASAFLPDGFPATVTDDYLEYQIWDSIQATSSYVRGVLSTQALLVGVGVGKEAATPLNAIFQFLLKDFSGMLGGVTFAVFQASNLDSHAKQWRLFADVFNNVGYALELASPMYPRAFLALACLGSISRTITGVAGNATRAALTQHFAQERNAADVSAKEGSQGEAQETATTMIGMLIGLAIVSLSKGSHVLLWGYFLALTALHLFANVRAMRALLLTSLNRPRVDLLVQAYLDAQEGALLGPREMAALEPLAPPPVRNAIDWAFGRPIHSIRFVSLAAMASYSGKQLPAALEECAKDKYVLHQCKSSTNILLRRDAETSDILMAYVQALLMTHNKSQEDARAWVDKHGQAFISSLATHGWAVDQVAVGQGQERTAWGTALHLHSD